MASKRTLKTIADGMVGGAASLFAVIIQASTPRR